MAVEKRPQCTEGNPCEELDKLDDYDHPDAEPFGDEYPFAQNQGLVLCPHCLHGFTPNESEDE